MLTPCRSKIAFVLGAWSPAEARSWPFFIFRLPAEAKSQLFKFVNVDPLQKQGHICFGTWSPTEARSWPFFIFRLPAEAKSQPFKFVDMLTPCKSKVAFVLGTSSPTEARSWPSFIFRLPAEARSPHFFQHMMIPEQNQCFYLYLIFTLIIWIFLKFSYYHVKLK